jgi:hypothetical protein
MPLPSTAAELQTLLEVRGLYPHYAAANGREPHDGYGLERKGVGWVTYRCGPMSASNEQYFATEAQAVASLIERLRANGFAAQLEDLR